MNKQINSIKAIAKNNRVLIGNFSYLGAISVFNLLIPLATYPYLIRVLGKDIYGVIVFAQAIISYFVLIVSFGFNTSATKEVSISRHDNSKLSEIVSSVLTIKACLLLISFILLAIALYFIPETHGYHTLFFLSMWLAVYEVIFPVWYFQGIEKMKYITFFTLTSKLIFLVLIFVMIRKPQNYLLVPIINGIGALIGGGSSLYLVFNQHKIKFRFQKLHVLKKYFVDSFPLFVSAASVSIFVQANKIIIGAFIGMADVAYYDLADKVVQLLKSPQILISQAIFPKTSLGKNVSFIKKMVIISIGIVSILFILTQIFATKIVLFLGGTHMLPAVFLLRILSIAILLVYMSQYTSVHTLLANGYNKIWMKIMITTGILYILLVIISGFFSKVTAINLVYVSLLTELYTLLGSYYYSKKLNLL